MRKRFWLAAGLVTAVCGASLVRQPQDPRVLPAAEIDLTQSYSNILPGDYVGPQVCGDCHPRQHELWSEHPHRRMNQLPGPQSIQGDFANATLELPNARVTFCTQGDDENYLMHVERDGRPLRQYRVTRTVGSRFMQFYIGVQTQGPEPPDHPLYREHMLQFAYSFKLGRWLPKNYFDPDGPEGLRGGVPLVEAVDRIHDVRPYSQICMNCHNTFPYAYRIFHQEFCGFPDGIVAAALEPLAAALASTTPVEPTVESMAGLNRKLDPDRHLVTLGISCESCHFGGREHALHQRQIRFAPTSPLVRVTSLDPDRPITGQRDNAPTINGICIQCHSGHARVFPNDASTCNSREGLDLHAGSCASRMSCVDCHEPHTAEPPPGGPVNPRHLAACVDCHTQYREPAAALAHGGHPASAGVHCLDCHMPRYTQGLDELVRSHRVTVPVQEEMIAAGSANACNLCHLDKSIRWTLSQLDRLWQRRIRPQGHWAAAYGGDLDRPVGEVWLEGANTHLRLVAVQSYARSPLGPAMLPRLLPALNDPEPLNRVFATFAIQQIAEDRLDPTTVEITAPPAVRAKQIENLRALLQQPVSGP